MILTCPQCATRYNADAAKFPPEGRNVRCAKCGHVWHQPGPDSEGQAPAPVAMPEPMAETPPEPQHEEEHAPISEPPRRAAYVAPSLPDEVDDEPAVAPARRKGMGLGAMIAGWGVLAALVAIIAWAAVSYRQQIATLWPQSASLYSKMGMGVNARGIAFTNVAYKRETQDGQPVLAVTGRLVNVSARDMPVPEIRVALMDKNRNELYHWDFAASVSMLRPGQTVGFLTRLSSPPAGASHLQVRFADNGS